MSTKKQRAESARKVAELVESFGGQLGDCDELSGPEWHFQTRGGDLRVSLWPDDDCDAVFMRFSEPARAQAAFSLDPRASFNPHSGKWNVHRDTAADALAELRARLERVTA